MDILNGVLMHWATYTVNVSNLGLIGAYKTKEEAMSVFNEYVEQSRSGYGRASAESVTLFNLNTQEPELDYCPGEDKDPQ
jgi:hypothetical protein